jgi:hypothetical protein
MASTPSKHFVIDLSVYSKEAQIIFLLLDFPINSNVQIPNCSCKFFNSLKVSSKYILLRILQIKFK